MKILLDTNIIIHREMKHPINEDIGTLFWWLDKLGYTKCIHPVIIDEVSKNEDTETRSAFLLKLKSYHNLPTVAPLHPDAQKISLKYDITENDKNDTILINELLSGRVDLLITEDRSIHTKALELGLDTKVFTIDGFLEKVVGENPDLLDYEVPSVKREYFGNIDVGDPFFASLKDDYGDFEKWFNRKSDQTAYVCKSDNSIQAFLYVKMEDRSESYSDITPMFHEKKRLKIGSFRVQLNGFKLGERFLKIVFDNALHLSVDEIYLTIFPKRVEQMRLIELLGDFGFQLHGTKKSASGTEDVHVRDFTPKSSAARPRTTFPFVSMKARKYLVPIYPEYHTNLFPDSILRTESPLDFVENEPFRNALSKVYVSRSLECNLASGDLLIFYRTGGKYKSVITTIGIVETVSAPVPDLSTFLQLCRKRSVFSDAELKQQWYSSPHGAKPYVVSFLYSYSFPDRLILKRLIELGIVRDVWSAPRGFTEIDDESFRTIIRETNSNERIVVD